MLRRTVLFLILSLAQAGVTPLPVAAQDSARTVGQSLSERFSALKNVFKRKKSPSEQPTQRGSQPQPPMPYDEEDFERYRVREANRSKPQPSSTRRTPVSASATDRRTRQSPLSKSRQEELDQALADLLAPTTSNRSSTSSNGYLSGDSEHMPSYLQGLVQEEASELDPVEPAEVAEPGIAPIDRSNPFDVHAALTGSPTEATADDQTQAATEGPSAPVEADAPLAEETVVERTEVASKVDADAASETDGPEVVTPETSSPVEERIADRKSELESSDVAASLSRDEAPRTPADNVRDAKLEAARRAFSQRVVDAPAKEASQATRSSSSQPTAAGQANLLVSYQQPQLKSDVEGPRQILVGRPASFEVTLLNAGHTTAHKVLASIEVPQWADIVATTPSTGIVQQAAEPGDLRLVQWRLDRLDAGDSQKLAIKLIPRSGQPLQLGVRWTQAPVRTTATVDVQEPKLNIAITGPEDVLYGTPQRYRLELSNPGTGPAENVMIRLTPPGGGEANTINHPIGTLSAGEHRKIELELVAREAGELAVKAAAIAVGGLQVETVKNVTCRKPEIEVDYRGPDEKYAGTTATYYFRVRNPGAASTSDYVVDVRLPSGAKLVAASEGHELVDTSTLRWKATPLGPGQERFLQVRCSLNRPGKNDITVTAESLGADLRDSKTCTTAVVAVADLKLEVSDPKGPAPVGADALYTLRVVNRGTTSASNVNVVAMFSSGVDPIGVEGAEFTLNDGRVAFEPIANLPAGEEVELTIRARAGRPGTHVFRAEVLCAELDTKLAAEETTRYFADEQRWSDASTAYEATRDEKTTRR